MKHDRQLQDQVIREVLEEEAAEVMFRRRFREEAKKIMGSSVDGDPPFTLRSGIVTHRLAGSDQDMNLADKAWGRYLSRLNPPAAEAETGEEER